MKLNERNMAHYATGCVPPDKSGFLMKKSARSGTFHRRWCVLKANLLFLFEERNRREPLGLVVLEGCTVELCESEHLDFAFAIRFGPGQAHTHTHMLAADTQEDMEDWAKALARASFQYLRLVVRELEKQLEEAHKRPEDQAAGCSGAISPLKPDLCNELRIMGKENGVHWDKPAAPNGVAWESECSARARPPPAPPRRKSPPEMAMPHRDMGVSHREVGVSPGTTSFSKLHDWYGKEVAQVRSEWLQSQ